MALFAASVDTPETNRRFAQQLGVDYPLLSDPERRTAAAYGVVADGEMFASRWTFYIGTDGRILFIDKQVNPTTAGRRILDKLGELGIQRRRAPGRQSGDSVNLP